LTRVQAAASAGNRDAALGGTDMLQRKHHARALAVLAGLSGVGLAASGAAAQTAVEDSVLNRPRPGYDALGIDLFAGPTDPGSPFILYPTLDVGGGWDDNVFREETDTDADFFVLVAPALSLVSDWVNHGLALGASAAIARYNETEQNNYTTFDLTASGFLDIGLDSQLYAGADFGRFVSPRDDVDNEGTNDLVKYWSNGQVVGFRTQVGDLLFDVNGARERFDYINNEVNQEDRDRTEWAVNSRLGYEFQPGVVLFAEGGYNWRIYDDTVDDFGYNRDSQGWYVRGGFGYDVTGVIFAEIAAGYEQQNYEDPAFPDASGFSIRGDITWNPTDLLTVRGSAGSGINETTLDDASGGKEYFGGLGLDFDLAENLILTTDALYTRIGYDAATGFEERKDELWLGRAGLIFLINEYFSLRADYTYSTRNSNVAGEDFKDNTIFVTLHSQL